MFPSAFFKKIWAIGGRKCRTRNLNPGLQGRLDPNWHHTGIHICHFWAMVGLFWSKPLPVQDFRLPLHEIWHHQIVETLSNQIRVVVFMCATFDTSLLFLLLHQLLIVNYYVKSLSNNFSNETINTGVSREIIFQT